MRDEDFQVFIDEFGEPTCRIDVPQASYEKWQGKLPGQLLRYWKGEGWCSYVDGLFWTVNPDDYEDLVDEWLEDTPFEEIDVFHVIARTAFGALYLCGEKTGISTTLRCPLHAITALKHELKAKSKEDLDWSIRGFFGSSEREYCDLNDESGRPLFERAIKELGKLKPNEIYGFEPALVSGGKLHLENLVKLDLDIHLTLLRQLSPPNVPLSKLDLEKLLKP